MNISSLDLIRLVCSFTFYSVSTKICCEITNRFFSLSHFLAFNNLKTVILARHSLILSTGAPESGEVLLVMALLRMCMGVYSAVATVGPVAAVSFSSCSVMNGRMAPQGTFRSRRSAKEHEGIYSMRFQDPLPLLGGCYSVVLVRLYQAEILFRRTYV